MVREAWEVLDPIELDIEAWTESMELKSCWSLAKERIPIYK